MSPLWQWPLPYWVVRRLCMYILITHVEKRVTMAPVKPRQKQRTSSALGQSLSRRCLSDVSVACAWQWRWFVIYLYIWIYRGDIYNILFIYFCITSVRWYFCILCKRKQRKKRAMVGGEGERLTDVPRHLVTQRNQAVRSAPRQPTGALGRPSERPCAAATTVRRVNRISLATTQPFLVHGTPRTEQPTRRIRETRWPVPGRKIVNAETPA